jgi:hypothetical protein
MVSKEFVLAGKSIFTVDNGKGEHYTYKVRAKEIDDKGTKIFFVSLLTGPDNTGDYTYLGVLNASDGSVRLTAKSKLTNDSKAVKVVQWAMQQVWFNAVLPEGYNIRHAVGAVAAS